MPQSFPPPNFIMSESTVDGIEVYRPQPEAEEDHREVVTFNCPQCHATTAYSATDGGLTCTHCGYYEAPAKEVVGKGAEAFEFTVAHLKRAAHGWGEARKELQCQNCGAYTSVPPDSLTHVCPFCGSNKVIQQDAAQDVLRPRFLVPFKIEAGACHKIARDWLGDSWMVPKALRQSTTVGHFSGIYLPFWTFDAVAEADWQAEVGHTETEHYYEDGKWKTRTKTVWKWESGHVRLGHDDILVDGTARLSTLLLGRIKNFSLGALASYEPTYLAGFQAQAYDVPLEKAWETSRHQMRELTKASCRSQASTNKIRNFSMTLDFTHETWRYILLPVYLTTYTYAEKPYQVMVNGQTGAITGQRPVDWLKVWLVAAAIVAPGVTIGLLGVIMQLLGRAAFLVTVAGFALFIGGLIVAISLLQKAQGLDDA